MMTKIKQNATMKDIARNLGLSISTVSRALRNLPSINQQTIEMVKKEAERLDYFPNSVARSLQQKYTTTIGVIVPEIHHYFFSSAIDGIEDCAHKAGYTIIVSKSNENYDREVLNLRTMVSNRVAGIIASVAQTTKDGEHFLAIKKRGFPIVLFDRVLDDVDVNKVIVDDSQGAYNATMHLVRNGFKLIAHLSGPPNLKISEERIRGYRQALDDAGLEYDDRMVIHVPLDEQGGVEGITKLLELEKKPDAIVAVNDPVAVGVHKEARSRGLKIPDDLGITGFSNNPVTEMIEPQLTTVDQHAYEMGRIAADMLLKEIGAGEENHNPETKVIKTNLIVRESSTKR